MLYGDTTTAHLTVSLHRHSEGNCVEMETSLQPVSPDSFLVGLIVGSDVVHVALSDDAQINVAARTQVVEDACSDGVTHQPLGFLLL